MSLKSLLKKASIGLGSLLLACNIGCNSSVYPQTTVNMEQRTTNLEEKISKPKKGISFNYMIESGERGADYFTSRAVFSQYSGILNYSPDILELSPDEITQIKDIINNIKFKNIDSYQSFVESAENLSENQKLVLLGAIGDLLGKFNYDYSHPEYEVASQVVFFNKLQDSLESGSHNNLGVCRHIHSHIEQLANDLGMEAAAVTGVNGRGYPHVYTVVQTENRCAIVDYGSILTTNTNNIEKVLEAYQKWIGTTEFEHLFFEDDDFKYRLITRDGRHFLDFIGYDESLKPLKDSLIKDTNRNTLEVILDNGNYLDSLEFNYQGFFIKAGNISGSSFSPMERMELLQTGYKGKFSILDVINVNGNMSLIYGGLNQDKELEGDMIQGITWDLVASLNNENPFDFSFRIAKSKFLTNQAEGTFTNNYTLFYDSIIGTGASYKFATEKLDIEPYIIVQFSSFPKDIGTWDHEFMFNELGIGALFDIPILSDAKLSIEPYYTRRMWEDEIGANVKLGNGKFKSNFGIYTTKSNYGFCPHKNGFNVGLYTTLKNLELGVGYKNEELDYSGEKENQESLNIGISAKF